MQAILLNVLVSALVKVLDQATVKALIDSMLDSVEDAIANSETKVDDAVVGPLILALRAALEVPDYDDNVKPASS